MKLMEIFLKILKSVNYKKKYVFKIMRRQFLNMKLLKKNTNISKNA